MITRRTETDAKNQTLSDQGHQPSNTFFSTLFGTYSPTVHKRRRWTNLCTLTTQTHLHRHYSSGTVLSYYSLLLLLMLCSQRKLLVTNTHTLILLILSLPDLLNLVIADCVQLTAHTHHFSHHQTHSHRLYTNHLIRTHYPSPSLSLSVSISSSAPPLFCFFIAAQPSEP